jgi:hypothetical protein
MISQKIKLGTKEKIITNHLRRHMDLLGLVAIGLLVLCAAPVKPSSTASLKPNIFQDWRWKIPLGNLGCVFRRDLEKWSCSFYFGPFGTASLIDHRLYLERVE